MNLIERLKVKFAALYAAEPARVNAAVVGLLVAAAGAVGVATGGVPVIAAVVAFFVPELVAELTRPKVVPEAKVNAVIAESVTGADVGLGHDSIGPGPDSLGP